jgi:hypothetical protein
MAHMAMCLGDGRILGGSVVNGATRASTESDEPMTSVWNTTGTLSVAYC